MNHLIISANVVYIVFLLWLSIKYFLLKINVQEFYEEANDVLMYTSYLMETVYDNYKEETGRHHEYDPRSPYKAIPDYHETLKLLKERNDSSKV